jgi:hypothetical protein
VKETVAEIKKVARKDPVRAGDGAVTFIERVSPALEHVESHRHGPQQRDRRPRLGHRERARRCEDPRGMARAAWERRTRPTRSPYIETLADYWGELSASRAIAGAWADRLVGITRLALSPDKDRRGYFLGRRPA